MALSPPESEETSGHQSLAIDKKQAEVEAEAQVEAAHGPAAETWLERLLCVFTTPLRLLIVLTIPDVTVQSQSRPAQAPHAGCLHTHPIQHFTRLSVLSDPIEAPPVSSDSAHQHGVARHSGGGHAGDRQLAW